jgi:hypothetical protein
MLPRAYPAAADQVVALVDQTEYLGEEYNEYRILSSPDMMARPDVDFMSFIVDGDDADELQRSSREQVISSAPIDAMARQHTAEFYSMDSRPTSVDAVLAQQANNAQDGDSSE